MEQKLKQRLVGAIVLISLAVIFIPIILEGPDDEWTPRSHSIPEPPQMDYGVPLVPSRPAKESASVVPTQTVVEPDAETEAVAAVEAETEAEQTEPAAAPAVAAPAEPVAADAPPPQAESETTAARDAVSQPDSTPGLSAGGWVIQVGSFSHESNANGLRERLKSSGYDAFLQDVAVGQSRAYRVVVGPLRERKAAELLRDRLANEMQLRGIVVENK